MKDFIKDFSPYIILVVGWVLAIVRDSIKNKRNKTDALQKGIQALLRDRLKKEHDQHVRDGWISTEEKANFDNMYQAYHNLGKNGVMTQSHAEVMELPTIPPKEV